MLKLFTILLTGMGISFLGSLPLGSLNMIALQIAVQANTKKAIFFALGVAMVEIIYVGISLTGMRWVWQHQALFYTLEWATVWLFFILALVAFLAAYKKNNAQKKTIVSNRLPPFWLGVSMSAINPAQIPFWFLWSTYLFSIQLLIPAAAPFIAYMMGIGIGTLTGLALFIFGGKWLVQKIQASNRSINIAVGIVFLLSAAIQLYRVLLHTK
jgi:threonine/homoserine/homoserine lactone efflux protein